MDKEVCFFLINDRGEKTTYLAYRCPGCKTHHSVDVTRWKFNGDMVKPTFSPSVLTGIENFTKRRCHSFVKDGKIQYLSDCFHELKNQTVDIPPEEE